LLVPINAFVPYNAQAIIHTYKSLWALLLPMTVPGRVSDIWRAYFAQAIFHHDIGLSVVMLPLSVQQERNDHNYLADMQAELDLFLTITLTIQKSHTGIRITAVLRIQRFVDW
jgi:hypothetical protein